MNNAIYTTSQTLSCLKCGKPFASWLQGNTYHAVCPHCSTIFEGYSGTREITNKVFVNRGKPVLDIPFGTIGTIHGVKYLVTGYVVKKEKGTNYTWDEYTLFNPEHGYAWLSVYNGHWMLLKNIDELPLLLKMEDRVLSYKNEVYRLFSKYVSVTQRAAGEFPFLLDISEPNVAEYINPPYILTSERTDYDIVWFHGEYIPSEEIKEGFHLENITVQSGRGVIQPYLAGFRPRALNNILVVLGLLLLIFQLLFYNTAKEETVYNQTFSIADSLIRKEVYTEPFELKYGTKNVEIILSTTVDNAWLYTGVTLVNEKTGDLYDIDIEAEFYHGYSGGESWTEGANWSSKVISSVPEGRYYLIIFPDKYAYYEGDYQITVKRDVPVNSNFFICVAILAIFPAIYYHGKKQFEINRWSQSNYTPPQYEEQDE